MAVPPKGYVRQQGHEDQEQQEGEGLRAEVVLPGPVEEIEEPDACPPAVILAAEAPHEEDQWYKVRDVDHEREHGQENRRVQLCNFQDAGHDGGE